MDTVEQIDVFIFKFPRHYKIAGHEETPGRLPGTDYYIEPEWRQVYSRNTETCLIKITASSGKFGWGEAQSPITPETTATLITTLLGPALLGRDADAIAALRDHMYHLMLARGHFGGFLVDAMAGLDMALWDLKGRVLGVSLSDLLGGAKRAQLPAYISGLRKKTLEEKIVAARGFLKAGFVGVKLFGSSNLDSTIAEARAVRDALQQNAFFALDALWSYTPSQALRVAKVLEELGGAWLEAPLDPEDLDGHADLAKHTSTPIAIGEVLRTPRAFAPWLKAGALRIAQPDVMRTGVSGALEIAALAREYDAATALHVGVSSGIGVAATWQVASTLPGDLPQEHQSDLFEVANRVLLTPLEERGGCLLIPTGDGIGVDVDEVAVKAHATEHWMVDARGRREAGGHR